jgi:hypothetical protein
MVCAPNRKKGKHLDNQSLGLLLKYWMGVPIFAENRKCHCGRKLDIYGDHALHCKAGGNITKRHDHVRDILVHFLQTASVQVSKELVGYNPGMKSRVGDLILPFGGNGLHTDSECLYDVSILSSLYHDRLPNSSKEKEYAAELAVRNKLTARKADLNGLIETSVGMRRFIPLGFESFGGFSSNSKKLVDFIAKEWSMKSGFDKAIAKSQIVSRISMAIHRGNAMCLMTSAYASLTHDLDQVVIDYPFDGEGHS